MNIYALVLKNTTKYKIRQSRQQYRHTGYPHYPVLQFQSTQQFISSALVYATIQDTFEASFRKSFVARNWESDLHQIRKTDRPIINASNVGFSFKHVVLLHVETTAYNNKFRPNFALLILL